MAERSEHDSHTSMGTSRLAGGASTLLIYTPYKTGLQPEESTKSPEAHIHLYTAPRINHSHGAVALDSWPSERFLAEGERLELSRAFTRTVFRTEAVPIMLNLPYFLQQILTKF